MLNATPARCQAYRTGTKVFQYLHPRLRYSSNMATLLKTRIEIFTYDTDSPSLPLPLQPLLTISSPTPPPTLSPFATNTHFQLLLSYRIGFPSITTYLLPLPKHPTSNTNTNGTPITISAPSRHKHHPKCPFHPLPLMILLLPSAQQCHVTLIVRTNTPHLNQYPTNVFLSVPTPPNFFHS